MTIKLYFMVKNDPLCLFTTSCAYTRIMAKKRFPKVDPSTYVMLINIDLKIYYQVDHYYKLKRGKYGALRNLCLNLSKRSIVQLKTHLLPII